MSFEAAIKATRDNLAKLIAAKSVYDAREMPMDKFKRVVENAITTASVLPVKITFVEEDGSYCGLDEYFAYVGTDRTFVGFDGYGDWTHACTWVNEEKSTSVSTDYYNQY